MRKAFSLPETMIIMALLGLILSIYAGMVQRYSAISRLVARKDSTMQAALVGLERMRSEVSQAVQVLEPLSGVAPELRFTRVNPTTTARLPEDVEDPVPTTTWRPHRTADLITVRYFNLGERLEREASSTVQGVARDVDGFSAELLADGNLRLTLTVKEENRVRTLCTELQLNTPAAVVP